MKSSLIPLFLALIAVSALCASAPPTGDFLGRAGKDPTNRLALIGRHRSSEIEALRQHAARLRGQREDILRRLESNERDFRDTDGKTSSWLIEANIRRKSLIEREQRTGDVLRSVEATIVSLETGKSLEAVEARWAITTGDAIPTELTSAEALALAESTLVASGRKLVDYWSLTPAVVRQDGRTLWQFRFHMKETNMPMDLAVGVTVDDVSRVGTIERRVDKSP